MGIKKMSERAVRIKLERPFELFFGCGPVPVVPKETYPECRMAVSDFVVDLDSLFRSSGCLWQRFVRIHFARECQRTIGVRNSGIRQCIRWINGNCVLKVLY